MLVLSRKKDESIIIQLPNGELVTITVVEVRGDKAKIGITAAKEIPVHRKEIYERIQNNNEAVSVN